MNREGEGGNGGRGLEFTSNLLLYTIRTLLGSVDTFAQISRPKSLCEREATWDTVRSIGRATPICLQSARREATLTG